MFDFCRGRKKRNRPVLVLGGGRMFLSPPLPDVLATGANVNCWGSSHVRTGLRRRGFVREEFWSFQSWVVAVFVWDYSHNSSPVGFYWANRNGAATEFHDKLWPLTCHMLFGYHLLYREDGWRTRFFITTLLVNLYLLEVGGKSFSNQRDLFFHRRNPVSFGHQPACSSKGKRHTLTGHKQFWSVSDDSRWRWEGHNAGKLWIKAQILKERFARGRQVHNLWKPNRLSSGAESWGGRRSAPGTDRCEKWHLNIYLKT